MVSDVKFVLICMHACMWHMYAYMYMDFMFAYNRIGKLGCLGNGGYSWFWLRKGLLWVISLFFGGSTGKKLVAALCFIWCLWGIWVNDLSFLWLEHSKLWLSNAWLVLFYRFCYLKFLFLICVDLWILLFYSCSGVDFKIKLLTVGGKRLKLTIWDTGNGWTYVIVGYLWPL